MQRTSKDLLDVRSGKIDITDPGYEPGEWCAITGLAVKPGMYQCWANVEDFVEVYSGKKYHDWRITRCGITLEGYDPVETIPFENIGRIGVDAGLAGFFVEKPDFDEKEWSSICGKLMDHDAKHKDPTDPEFRTYELRRSDGEGCDGFFTQSGFGDGSYDVFAERAGGEIVALEIEFIQVSED